MKNKKWYAVMRDRDDNDWGYGSADRDEAEKMAVNMLGSYPDAYIAVIEEGPDPICVEELTPDDFSPVYYYAASIVKANDWNEAKDDLEALARWLDKRTESVLIVRHGNVQNYFYLYGGRDASSYQYIQGITLGGIMFDEVALMPRSFVDQGCARCSLPGSRYWFNCNPDKPSHWFYQEWIQKKDEQNALYIHFELEDNPGLTEHVIQRYKNMYTGIFYQRYILGLWVNAEGVIFQQFANNPEKWILDEVPKGIRYLIEAVMIKKMPSNLVKGKLASLY